MLHWPTAVGFHNHVLSSIKPLISVGLPTPYSTVDWPCLGAPSD